MTEERFRGQQPCSQGHPALLPLDSTEWQGPINSCQGDIVRGNVLLRNSVKEAEGPGRHVYILGRNEMLAMENKDFYAQIIL